MYFIYLKITENLVLEMGHLKRRIVLTMLHHHVVREHTRPYYYRP